VKLPERTVAFSRRRAMSLELGKQIFVLIITGWYAHNPSLDCSRGFGTMHSIIYLVGLIVVVMFILSLLGLH
jgi:hypothetical protein